MTASKAITWIIAAAIGLLAADFASDYRAHRQLWECTFKNNSGQYRTTLYHIERTDPLLRVTSGERVFMFRRETIDACWEVEDGQAQ